MSPRTSPRILERFGHVAALAALPCLLAASAFAGTYYSQGSLSPSDLASWNSIRAGGGSGPADFTSGDVFVVQDTHAMPAASSWTLSGAGTALVIESGGALLVPAGQALAIAGPLTIAGTLTLDAAAGDLEVGGDWTVAAGGTFTPGGRTVIFGGASDQVVTSGGGAFAGLTLANSGGDLVLADDLAVDGTLTLAGGNVETGAFTLAIGPLGGVSRTSGHVAGRLEKTVAAGTGTSTFEVGDASRYAPVTVTGTGAGFASAFQLAVSTAPGDHPDLAASGLASDRSVNRTYTLAQTGYTGGTFELTCDFDPADLDAGAAPGRFVTRRHAASAWTACATGTRGATSTQATGLAAFGEFAIGEQAIDHYDVSAASPQTQGDTFTTTVAARDVLGELVADDSATAVTMTSSGAAEFDADGNATFGDNVKTLAGGTFGIATRDDTAETLSLTATDANAKTGSRSALVVQDALSITTASLPAGTAGSVYSQGLAAAGGTAPYGNWTVTVGALPAGLALDSGTGVIGGTPTTAGTQAFTVQVGDAGGHTATRALSIDITCPVIAVTPVSLSDGDAGIAYSETIGASGGTAPYSYAVTSGSLPAGLALGASSGDLTGTPTETGSFPFTVTATDAFGCTGERAYTLLVVSSCPGFAVLPASLPAGSVTIPYSQSVSASAGQAPFTFTITSGSPPAGLTLSPGGVLSGTPSASGTFPITIQATDANACTGSRAYLLDVLALPAAIADLAGARQESGNDGDGTARVQVTFTPPPGAATVQVYRAKFGGYPRYDNAGGAPPAVPSYPPGAAWELTAVTASGQADEPASRDFWYYVAFTQNAAGGRSPVSNRSAGALDYHLGDVSNGVVMGQGDNQVGDEDVSLLGANYGIVEPALTTRGVHYLDVGPTTDLALTSRPFTDGRIDFEDFIVFATNYFTVSAPALAALPAATGSAADELLLAAPASVEPGQTVRAALGFRGAGRVQGFSAELGWDPSVVEPLAVEPGTWIASQHGLVLSPRPGVVDAALLGVRGQGLAGEGPVAAVPFRVLRAGDPAIRIVLAIARDANNRAVELATSAATTGTPRAWTTALASPWPNPARGNATLEFSLATASRVDLAVYSVDGRRVKTLARGEREPGAWKLPWDGTDDDGNAVAPGLYYARLQAGDHRYTRRLVLLR